MARSELVHILSHFVLHLSFSYLTHSIVKLNSILGIWCWLLGSILVCWWKKRYRCFIDKFQVVSIFLSAQFKFIITLSCIILNEWLFHSF
jgi:hypothetical protein